MCAKYRRVYCHRDTATVFCRTLHYKRPVVVKTRFPNSGCWTASIAAKPLRLEIELDKELGGLERFEFDRSSHDKSRRLIPGSESASRIPLRHDRQTP